jgi:dihydrofolate synthase/folylpolyglutamate synthase
MITSYREAVDYLYQNLPMFQRVGAAALKKDLSNTITLCEALGNPQNRFRSIHIAGTNGKGSTAHMIAAVLQSAGYKTGLYTSPHLKSFTERIRVNGAEMDEGAVTAFVNRTLPLIEMVKPSFFEITVAMAFDYFASQEVDVAVVEVGLGGRLDSTNVILPVVSVITNIGMDHKELLGGTKENIAREKAGIIKEGVPVVVSERQQEVEHVFCTEAAQHRAPLVFADDTLKIRKRQGRVDIVKGNNVLLADVEVGLKGSYQDQNLCGAMMALLILRGRGFVIPDDPIRHGISNVTTLTGLRGRWQQLRERPLVICDTAHNVEGLRRVVTQILEQRYTTLHIVFGITRERDPDAMLAILPKDARYYFCRAAIPRAMDPEVLARHAKARGFTCTVIPDVSEAVRTAIHVASPDGMVFIGGSTFVVAEVEGI